MWNPMKTYRLDALFFIVIVSFIVLLLMVVIWFGYHYSAKQMADNTSYYQQRLLDEIRKQLRIRLTSIEQISQAASRNGELNQFLSMKDKGYERYLKQRDLETYLAQIIYSSNDIESIEVVMNNSPVAINEFAVHFRDQRQLEQEPWFDELMENDFIWIGERMVESYYGETSVISFARVLSTSMGRYLGTLVINVKAPAIHSIIIGETENPATNRMLTDTEGRLIATIGSGFFPEQELAEHVHRMEGASGQMRSTMVGPSGQERDYLLVWSQFPSSDWMLIEATPWTTITKGSVRMASALVLIGGAASLAALFFGLCVSRQFTRPIRLLLTEMGKFTGASTVVNLPDDYNNEFGAMFQGYRRLNNKIHDLYDSLKVQYKRQKESELRALQAQFNPHFLYNTLDRLNWMAIERGQEEISHVLELTGKMFRIGLSGGKSLIPIRDELEHLACYVRIQQIHWGKGLQFEQAIPDSILDMYIPKLTLQPFVENSILHGFHGRSRGRIIVTAEVRDGDLVFTVTDDGGGFRQQRNGKRDAGGYGIRNVKERIEAAFGPHYGVNLQNGVDGGTVVTLKLPVLDDDQIDFQPTAS